MMSRDEASRRLALWNEWYVPVSNRKEASLTFLGRKLIVPKEVFVPDAITERFSKSILKETETDDKVLDMGTGSGINAIVAALKSRRVLAVDINPFAVKCARENAARNGVSDRVKVVKSNLFRDVGGKFDLVIFNPPFAWYKPRDIRERSVTDEGFRTLSAFFRNVGKHLEKNGRVMLFYGSEGDIKYLELLIGRNGFESKIIHREMIRVKSHGWMYYTYKLTQKKGTNRR